MNKTRGRGRPAGPSHTREQILDVARRRFLAEGYQRVTLRSIAAEAGVDVALISYFFGSKSGLFGATMSLSVNPARAVASALPGDLNALPERLLTVLVTTWDDPDRGPALRAMAEAGARDPDVRRLLRELVYGEIIARLAERLGGADATARAGMAAAQIVGIIFGRYVLRLEPLASMPAEEVVRRSASAMRAALAGPRR